MDASRDRATDVALRLSYAELRLQKGFDELLSLGAIRDVEHFGYRLETVRRVLRDFRGRVLLADEVGLGKTIEACLTLKEYWMRSLARKALIFTPASLVGQWVDELIGRFARCGPWPPTPNWSGGTRSSGRASHLWSRRCRSRVKRRIAIGCRASSTTS